MKNLNIGYAGNFEPPHSTENERGWSFNKLGHNVVAFQENQVSKQDILDSLDKIDLLVYSHTHGWEIEGLKEVFAVCKEQGLPTVSVHLDRWAWLEREKDVGKEATWFTEYLFMADASPEAVRLYKKYNLNWHYLKAGVVEKDCYMAAPDRVRFPHEIVFVGSKGYHKEYPFRKKLVEWLHKTYGKQFGHYGDDLPSLRGHDLNTLYATAKIVIGDSCFGDRPNYVSDRYYETRGRGGFLLHPEVEGVDHIGIGFYKARNLESLHNAIEYWLENLGERIEKRKLGFNWVRNRETYTNRAREILKEVYETH